MANPPIFEPTFRGRAADVAAILARDPDAIAHRTAKNLTPMHVAASRGHADVIALLVAHGGDVQGPSTGGEWTPLVFAAYRGHLDAVNALLDLGADPTASGGNPIHYAGQRGHVDICRSLVAHGAVDRLVRSKDRRALALFRAAYSYDPEGVRAVLEAAPRLVDTRDRDGRTPMHEAATNGDAATVGVLLAFGGDPSATDERGQTPLDRARAHRREKVVKLLAAASGGAVAGGPRASRRAGRAGARTTSHGAPGNSNRTGARAHDKEGAATVTHTAPARGTIRDEPGFGRVEVFELSTDRATVERVIRYLFERWWSSIRFGPLFAGAVFEGRCESPPTVRRVDGFLTVHLDRWHFSVCVGPSTRGFDSPGKAARCPSRAELYRLLDAAGPVSWGFRLTNGVGQQVLSVTLPNPYLDDELAEVDEPDWGRLACWNHLRRTHLGLRPDPFDRAAAEARERDHPRRASRARAR